MKWILACLTIVVVAVMVEQPAKAGDRCFVQQRVVAAPVVFQRQRIVRQPVFVRQPVVVQRQRFVRQPVFVQRQRFVRQPVFVQQRFVGRSNTLRNLSLLGVFGRDSQRFSAFATGLGF